MKLMASGSRRKRLLSSSGSILGSVSHRPPKTLYLKCKSSPSSDRSSSSHPVAFPTARHSQSLQDWMLGPKNHATPSVCVFAALSSWPHIPLSNSELPSKMQLTLRHTPE